MSQNNTLLPLPKKTWLCKNRGKSRASCIGIKSNIGSPSYSCSSYVIRPHVTKVVRRVQIVYHLFDEQLHPLHKRSLFFMVLYFIVHWCLTINEILIIDRSRTIIWLFRVFDPSYSFFIHTECGENTNLRCFESL